MKNCTIVSLHSVAGNYFSPKKNLATQNLHKLPLPCLKIGQTLFDIEIYAFVPFLFIFRYLTTGQVKLLKFDLSLRSFSPKIEMFQQVANDRLLSKKLTCDTIIDYNGHLSCDLPSNPKKTDEKITQIDEDHRYPHWDDEAQDVVVLYAQAGNGKFGEYHRKLSDLASQGKIKYIFRHFLAKRSEHRLRLSGTYLSIIDPFKVFERSMR
jgi:hypothetical protein